MKSVVVIALLTGLAASFAPPQPGWVRTTTPTAANKEPRALWG